MADMIVQHHHWQKDQLGRPTPVRTFFAALLVQQRRRQDLPPTTSLAIGSPAIAYVNQGRWVADCPAGDGGAMCVSEAEPIFMCPECWNAAVLGLWRPVEFPAEKAAIELALLDRPAANPWLASSRNWEPGETVRTLIKDNRRRELGPPHTEIDAEIAAEAAAAEAEAEE